MNNKRAFTLIELSIALVIIALLVAGIVTGQELIRAARLRSTVQQFHEYESAVLMFRNKYNCLPGDCARAEQMNLGISGDWGANGDGNGSLSEDDVLETANFWYHLDAAGMIKAPLKLSFPSPIGAQFTSAVNTPRTIAEFRLVGTSNRAGWIVLGGPDLLSSTHSGPPHHLLIATGTFPSVLQAAPTVTPLDAYTMDKKIDDSLPLSGKVYAWRHIRRYFLMAATAGAGSASGDFCVANDVTPNQYNLLNQSGTTGLCTLSFRTSF